MHVTDLMNVYGGMELTNYLVRFVNNLDPNGLGNTIWPQYTASNPQLFTFLDGTVPNLYTSDTYRQSQMTLLNSLSLSHPW